MPIHGMGGGRRYGAGRRRWAASQFVLKPEPLANDPAPRLPEPEIPAESTIESMSNYLAELVDSRHEQRMAGE